ncbi:hypothetical protein [Sphingopyxis sp. NJF-3]
MIEHDDVLLDTDRKTLLALAHSIAEVAIDDSEADLRGQGVWLRLRDGECLQVAAISVGLAFKFEVFPLFIGGIEALRARMATLRPMLEHAMREAELDWPLQPIPEQIVSPVPFDPWPESDWTLEVLQRREWIADPDLMGPEGLEASIDLLPGEVPRGTEQAGLVALGLLFSFAGGDRLLIASADWPPDTLTTTRNAAQIDAFLKPCFRVEASRYANMLSG